MYAKLQKMSWAKAFLVFEILGPVLAKVSITKAGEVDGLKKKVMKEKKA